MKYIISEVQNLFSEREGHEYEAESLSQAKRFASKIQCFCSTVLKIEDVSGNLIAYKQNGKWNDIYEIGGRQFGTIINYQKL